MRRVPTIVLVDAAESDVALLQEAFAELGHEVELVAFADGGEAMRFLAVHATGDAPRPELVVVDRDLDDRDGLGLARDVVAMPGLGGCRACVLGSEDDVEAAADGIPALAKPLTWPELLALARRLWHSLPATSI